MICHTKQGDIIFDIDDFDKIKNYKWFINPKKYANAYTSINNEKKYICFSRTVMDEPDGMIVDHKNKNTLDNRKENLRIVSVTENNRWKKVAKNNKHGVTGIYLDKKTNCWTASICVDLKQIFLGYYKTKDEAIIARLLGEKKYYGEYAPQQHLFEKYNINNIYFDGINIETKKENKHHKWSDEEKNLLKSLYESGRKIEEISKILELPISKIESKIQKSHFRRKSGDSN